MAETKTNPSAISPAGLEARLLALEKTLASHTEMLLEIRQSVRELVRPQCRLKPCGCSSRTRVPPEDETSLNGESGLARSLAVQQRTADNDRRQTHTSACASRKPEAKMQPLAKKTETKPAAGKSELRFGFADSSINNVFSSGQGGGDTRKRLIIEPIDVFEESSALTSRKEKATICTMFPSSTKHSRNAPRERDIRPVATCIGAKQLYYQQPRNPTGQRLSPSRSQPHILRSPPRALENCVDKCAADPKDTSSVPPTHPTVVARLMNSKDNSATPVSKARPELHLAGSGVKRQGLLHCFGIVHLPGRCLVMIAEFLGRRLPVDLFCSRRIMQEYAGRRLEETAEKIREFEADRAEAVCDVRDFGRKSGSRTGSLARHSGCPRGRRRPTGN